MKYGVMRFLKMENFVDPLRGLPRHIRSERLFEHYASDANTSRKSINDWPQVRDALCRGTQFVVEATTPIFKIILCFSHDNVDKGDYEIRYQRPARIEKGHTINVIPVPADERQEPVSMLAGFKVRYVVQTAAGDRSKTHLMWLIGLNDFRRFDAPDDPA